MKTPTMKIEVSLIEETVSALRFFAGRTRQHAAKARLLYAIELARGFEEHLGEIIHLSKETLEELCLCGALSWEQYSRGGMSLISNRDILERCVSPSLWKVSGKVNLIKLQARFLKSGFEKLYEELSFQVSLQD